MMRHDRPLVCLVTDGQQLGESDGCGPARDAALVELAREAAEAAVDLIQIRERSLEAARLCDLVAAIVDLTRGSSTLVVVNDRLDVALAAGADGVHLRGDSIPPRAVRTIVPRGFVIGRSVHHVDDARACAADVDYLIAGTVYATASKPPGAPLRGVSGLHDIAAAVDVPVLAIGGITLDRIHDVAAAGAAGIAAITLFLPGTLPLARVIAAVRAQFDSVKTAP
jgi:thiamine-phosphate diphosphorylase